MSRVIIRPDINSQSPREWDNLGTVVTFGKYSYIGDDDAKQKLIDDLYELGHNDSFYSELYYADNQVLFELANNNKNMVALPVYLYDHSGITISTTPFSCSWDSGLAGIIYVKKTDVRENYSVKRISKKLLEKVYQHLAGEINTLDQFLTGDIYGFEITDNEGDVIDSCWGFYGNNVKENGMLDYISKEYHSQALETSVTY